MYLPQHYNRLIIATRVDLSALQLKAAFTLTLQCINSLFFTINLWGGGILQRISFLLLPVKQWGFVYLYETFPMRSNIYCSNNVLLDEIFAIKDAFTYIQQILLVTIR